MIKKILLGFIVLHCMVFTPGAQCAVTASDLDKYMDNVKKRLLFMDATEEKEQKSSLIKKEQKEELENLLTEAEEDKDFIMFKAITTLLLDKPLTMEYKHGITSVLDFLKYDIKTYGTEKSLSNHETQALYKSKMDKIIGEIKPYIKSKAPSQHVCGAILLEPKVADDEYEKFLPAWFEFCEGKSDDEIADLVGEVVSGYGKIFDLFPENMYGFF